MTGLPQEGQPFGRYDITRRLGRGGMGVVYAAVQRGLGREVALKVLSSDHADNEEYRGRFLREAEVLARLDSPHIVSVHDSGEQDGWLYIAMQLIPDGDLHAKLKEHGPMPTRLALDVAAQVADGIADAHRAGIIHRDVKPSNVLLRQLGPDRVQAYVCDLGISRVLDAQHTRTQGVIGTFAYMAPERHEGHAATESSDIYALGCLLWASLTGAAPYTGADSQVVLGHLHAAIPQLDRSDELGSGVNRLLRRVMAKNPADRHATASEFSADCRTLADMASRTPETVEGPAAAPSPVRAVTELPEAAPVAPAQEEDLVQPGGPDESSARTAPSRGSRRPLVAGIVLAAVLAVVGIGAVALTLGRDEGAKAEGGTQGTSGDRGAASAPTDATVRDFCSAFDEFNFNPDYAQSRASVERMVEVGTPAAMTGQQREGFVKFVTVVQASPTEDEFVSAFSALDSEESADVDAFQAYTRSEC